MIVFGHNSFVLKSCKPSQLGLPVEIDQQYQIERRQRYAHIFWIPAFGIGKIWVMRDIKTDKLYEPNAVLLQVLNALPLQEKTPWYTFSLLLLALAAAIITPIYMQVDQYASNKRHEAYKLEQTEAMKKAIESPGKHQYFELRDADYKKTFLKVVGSDQNSLKCLSITGDYSDPGFLEAFAQNKGKLDTILVDKKKLIKTIGEESISNASPEAALPDGYFRIISAKYEYNDALFHTVAVGFEEGEFVATLQNLAADVTLDSISVKNGNLTLSAIPEKLASGEQFILVGTYEGMEPQYTGEWTFKNGEGKVTSYDVYINSSRIYFTKKS